MFTYNESTIAPPPSLEQQRFIFSTNFSWKAGSPGERKGATMTKYLETFVVLVLVYAEGWLSSVYDVRVARDDRLSFRQDISRAWVRARVRARDSFETSKDRYSLLGFLGGLPTAV